VHAPKALRFLIDVVGIDNVLLGTDYSFPPADWRCSRCSRRGLSKGESRRSPTRTPRVRPPN
jgi:aminocarboxymuconate-semialdehyde decarboxylase